MEENEYKTVIEVNKFQQKILDCISSGKVDEYFNASRFTDNPDAKVAMIYGMCIASMLTSECDQIIGKYDKMGESI